MMTLQSLWQCSVSLCTGLGCHSCGSLASLASSFLGTNELLLLPFVNRGPAGALLVWLLVLVGIDEPVLC